jgi:uncharacterized integral membrane protein (TIGR00698 family)
MIAPRTSTNPLLAELKQIGSELRPALPGLYLVIAVAVVSRYLHDLIPAPGMARAVSEVFIAVLLGLHVRNAIRMSKRFDAGIRFALQRVLRLGIILLGLRLSLQDVISTGLSALLIILACVAFALGLAYLLGRWLKIPARLAALIGVGTAICGNSAIIATAPVIEARDEDVSFAVATITFFGTLAVILYPTIGYFTGMTDRLFGLWAGTAILDTSQVVAAGAAFSDAARDIATVVKLVRNTLMAPLILVIGIIYSQAQHRRDTTVKVSVDKFVPWFVLAFLAMTIVRTVGNQFGFFPLDVNHPNDMMAEAAFLRAVDEVAKFAILMALSAIGLSTDVESIRRTGLKPVLLGFAVGGSLAVFSQVLIRLVE